MVRSSDPPVAWLQACWAALHSGVDGLVAAADAQTHAAVIAIINQQVTL
jgi:hypothetical protein